MKAPVGLLSGRAVCVSRWRGVASTSSAERSKRIFTGGAVEGNGICSAAFCESAALRERLYLVFTTLSVKNAFGALRRARQTPYIKRSFRYICPERKRRAFLIFPLSRWTLKCVILGENDAHRRDDHAI